MIDFSKEEFDPVFTSINSRLAGQHDQLLFWVGYLGMGLDLSVKASGLTPLYVAVHTYLGECSMIRCKLVLTKAADYRFLSGLCPESYTALLMNIMIKRCWLYESMPRDTSVSNRTSPLRATV